MLAKSAVFFFALVAFVNAAPIIDYDTDLSLGPVDVSDPIELDPSVEIRIASDGLSNRETSLDIGADLDFDFEIFKRDSVGIDLELNHPGVSVTLPHLKRGGGNFDTMGQRLSDAFDTVNQQLSNELSNLNQGISQGLNSLSRDRRDLNVNKARDIVIDNQTLVQLQSFVNDTVNLLRAVGKSDAVHTFLSQINDLKNDVRDGTLDLGDLLSAAQSVLLSL